MTDDEVRRSSRVGGLLLAGGAVGAAVWGARHLSPASGYLILGSAAGLVLLAAARRRARARADTHVQGAHAGTRAGTARAWVSVVAVGAPAAGLVWVGRRLDVAAHTVLAGSAAVCCAALLLIFRRWHPSRQTVPGVSSGGGENGLRRWRREVPARWSRAAYAAKLVRTHPGADAHTPEEDDPRRSAYGPAGLALITGPVMATPGGVAFAVDLQPADKIAADVVAGELDLRRGLGARAVIVERLPDRDDVVVLHVYRSDPFWGRRPPDWRDMRPVDPSTGCVPVGVTAYADLSGAASVRAVRRAADAVRRTVRRTRTVGGLAARGRLPSAVRAWSVRDLLGGRQAVHPWRGSTLIVSVPNAGKSAFVRAYLRGLLVQGIPFALYISDPKGDFAALRDACAESGGRYVRTDADTLGVLREVDAIGDDRYATQGTRYQHDPDPAGPLIVLVVGEWLEFIADAPREAVRLAERIVRWHRGSAISLITTAQLSQQRDVGPIRDMFPHGVVLRVRYARQADMALGEDAVRHGAAAHTIPKAGQGWFYGEDPQSGWPYLGWTAWIPEEEQDEALVGPIREMAARMPWRRVIDGELDPATT